MTDKETKTIKIFNTDIQEVANLKPIDFLERTENVKAIRTSESLSFTFYPTDEIEIDRNRRIWEYVNGNLNAMNYEYRYYFVAEFPEWLYLFLKYSTWDNVERSIVTALTGLYTVEPSGRKFIEGQIDSNILRKVEDSFEEHFKEFESFVFIEAEDLELMDEINSDYWEKERLFITKFDYFYRDNSGNPIILPYIYPVRDYRFSDRSLFIRKKFEVNCVNSYFTDSDWDSVINKKSSDSLHRSESIEEPWIKWRQKFKDKYKVED